jgi:organic radical activating enzyme
LKALPVLPFLETMITQVCNLSCHGCTNFSDLKHTGYVTWNQGQSWLQSWVSRIEILDFGIMGGEPMINPEWQQWVAGVRELMPDAQIRFTTNGLLLHRCPDILNFFEHIGNVVFKISVHVQDDELENTIKNFQTSRPWEEVEEHGIKRWRTKNNLRFQLNRPDWFYKTFRGTYQDMLPYDSDPIQAFDACVQQTCPLLHNGHIYKCSTSALTAEILKRHKNTHWDQWHQYLDTGIYPDCSELQLQAFLNNFGRHNAICGQCPTAAHTESKLNHYQTVVFK